MLTKANHILYHTENGDKNDLVAIPAWLLSWESSKLSYDGKNFPIQTGQKGHTPSREKEREIQPYKRETLDQKACPAEKLG